MRKLSEEAFMLEKIKFLREPRKKRTQYLISNQLDKPISFWIKEERLLKGKGKEFTIILRTKGCSWALGETGGCSMCGYIQDSYLEDMDPNHIINQFEYALQMKLEEMYGSKEDFIIKIFNSGSFFDENEISGHVREHIYKKIADIENVKEVVLETRVEFISKEMLEILHQNLKNKYIEIAIGLETVNDYIRNHYVNKGLLYEDFIKKLELLKEYNIGIRVYLLLKPPFLNEQGAIDDCVYSLLKLVRLEVDTISINPVNIQKGTLVEYLWHQKRYRPPWYYSLFKCLIKFYKLTDNFNSVRIISDPSGAGTKRGIHNCLRRECNEKMNTALKNFVLSQDINYILDVKENLDCDCKLKYYLQKNYS